MRVYPSNDNHSMYIYIYMCGCAAMNLYIFYSLRKMMAKKWASKEAKPFEQKPLLNVENWLRWKRAIFS